MSAIADTQPSTEEIALTNAQQGPYGVAILFGLSVTNWRGEEKHVYGGTVPEHVIARRRAKNRAARAARRRGRTRSSK